jgi:hypothetical protein
MTKSPHQRAFFMAESKGAAAIREPGPIRYTEHAPLQRAVLTLNRAWQNGA